MLLLPFAFDFFCLAKKVIQLSEKSFVQFHANQLIFDLVQINKTNLDYWSSGQLLIGNDICIVIIFLFSTFL